MKTENPIQQSRAISHPKKSLEDPKKIANQVLKLGNHNDIPFFSEIMCICRSFSFLVSKSKPRNVVTPMAPHHRLPMISWTATEPTGPTGSMKYGGFGRILLKKRDVVVNSCQLMSENLKIWENCRILWILLGVVISGIHIGGVSVQKLPGGFHAKADCETAQGSPRNHGEKKMSKTPLPPQKKKCYLPSGYVKIAIENGPLIDDLPSGNLT